MTWLKIVKQNELFIFCWNSMKRTIILYYILLYYNIPITNQMMRNSQMVAAFGRRLFDEGELKETTTEEEDEDAEEVNTVEAA